MCLRNLQFICLYVSTKIYISVFITKFYWKKQINWFRVIHTQTHPFSIFDNPPCLVSRNTCHVMLPIYYIFCPLWWIDVEYYYILSLWLNYFYFKCLFPHFIIGDALCNTLGNTKQKRTWKWANLKYIVGIVKPLSSLVLRDISRRKDNGLYLRYIKLCFPYVIFFSRMAKNLIAN
jgi:hypothetical protein